MRVLLPAGSPLTTGTFKPTSLTGGTTLVFPAPAPVVDAADYAATDGSATLTSTFNNTAPNGTWELFAMANSADDGTSIGGGWCVMVTPLAGPVITLNPVSQTVTAGSTATFTAAASGVPTPTVQWQVSTDSGTTFNNVTGATSTTLSFTTTAGQNGNKYRAVFTNAAGSATTTAAMLTVNFAPTVTTNPVSQTVTAGATAAFTAAATGNPTPTVQWQVSTDGGATFNNITGATSTTLSFTAAGGQNGNQYRAVFTNSVGSATTTAATLTVNSGPVVTLNPVNVTVNAGSTATFTAAATGNPTPTVQWQVSTDGGATFANVTGATSTTLSFTAAAGQNGHLYRAVFTNSVTAATTTAATLTVDFAPTVTLNPSNQTLIAGSTVTFTAAASGNPTPTVQWQVSTNGGATFTNVTGATFTTLSFTAAAAQNGYQYRALFTNSVSPPATTTAATLTVDQPPAITSANYATFMEGTAGSFTVTTTGLPVPTLTFSPAGSLPSGVSFVDNHNGTATLSGTPTVSGLFPFWITASNGVTPPALQSFSLTVSPAIAVTPTSLAFGNVVVGVSATKSVTLKNNSGKSVGIGPVTFTVTTGAKTQFSLGTVCPATLTAGASCTIGVNFIPNAVGTDAATLNIVTSVTGSPLEVPITAAGIKK